MSTDLDDSRLICEQLFGWKRHCNEPDCHDWAVETGARYWGTPTFDNWNDAGLILDWVRLHVGPGVPQFRERLAYQLKQTTLTPLSVRREALGYLRKAATHE